MPSLSIIIPVRTGGNPYTTLRSLSRSTWHDFEVIVAQDEWGNANKARNAGYALASPTSEYVLFSDDDIEWERSGIEAMMAMLRNHPGLAYSYGSYLMGGKEYCGERFDSAMLRRKSCISTMSVIRRDRFPGWDESVERLQDWALFLTMLENGDTGQHCGALCFKTAVRDGITRNGKVSYDDAYRIVREKHDRRWAEMQQGFYGSQP